MTCIVGLVTPDGTVHLGGDSAGVAGYALAVRKDAKVFRNGEFVFGFTSSFRMGQLLRYSFEPPPIPDGMDLDRYLVTLFADAVRACFKAGGFARRDHEEESAGTFLIGARERLFIMESDYQVGELRVPFAAVGCGAEIALGALHATEGWPPRLRLRTALEAAEAWSAGVRGPFTFVELPGPTWPVLLEVE